jgi:EAL domain-containing protein (putative c-di-GMP-specific phosphodiesterase class I)
MALREIGCDLVQGFLTGRPVPLATIIKGRTATSQPVGHAPTDSIGSDRSR